MQQTAAASKASTATPPVPNRRMALSAVVTGIRKHPIRVLAYGPEKVGKSTFASQAPAPIVLDTEHSTDELDVPRFADPGSWEDVLAAIRELVDEPHEYQSLIVDTLDHAEPLLWAQVCREGGVKSIEDFGYGRGYTAAVDGWRRFLRDLEELQRKRSMNVILLAHSQIRTFKNPDTSGDFDRYQLKINEKAAGLLKEWASAVLFCNYETLTAKDDRTKRVRGIDTGVRLLHTQRRAAFDAGNRYSLPDTLPLSWADFEAAVAAAQPADPRALVIAITTNSDRLSEPIKIKALDALKRANGDARKLAQLHDWVIAKLNAEKEN